MKSIIITGATGGIGFECAKKIARIAPDKQIVIACRNQQSGNEVVKNSKQKTGHQNSISLIL